jgi:hypothetical protein
MISCSLQQAYPIDEETALVVEGPWAVSYVFPGQSAYRFSMQTTAPQMAPGGSDSRRFYDCDGTRIHRAHHCANERVPLTVQRRRVKVGWQWRTEINVSGRSIALPS